MTLKLALLKVSLSDLSAQWSLLYSTTQPYATLHRSHLHAPYLVERRLSHTHSHTALTFVSVSLHLYLYLCKVLLGVRLRDSTLTLHQRRAAKRTRLINYQVECPVSKFDLEHKFRYSGRAKLYTVYIWYTRTMYVSSCISCCVSLLIVSHCLRVCVCFQQSFDCRLFACCDALRMSHLDTSFSSSSSSSSHCLSPRSTTVGCPCWLRFKNSLGKCVSS